MRVTRGLSGGARFRVANAIGAMVIAGFGISAAMANVAPPTADVVVSDLAHRSPDIHWPPGFLPESADMFSYSEIMINANYSTVWRHLVAASHWPEWYPNAHDVRLPDIERGILREHTRFEWNTFGVHIDSTVNEYVPENRLGWFGKRPSVAAYHTWLLAPVADGLPLS
ncbi:MAG: SRPBCC family protein [Steroidobacteraceae bacterium]